MTAQPLDEPLPGFTLADLSGEESSLDDALARKRGAVVVFWSATCSHCRRYDEFLRRFAERHGELALIVVACRQDETAADLRRSASERRLDFPILHDITRRVAHDWLVSQTPRVFLIDPERRLRYRGAIDNFKYPHDPDYVSYLEPAIGRFLAGQPIERPETASFGCPVESVYYDIPKPLRS